MTLEQKFTNIERKKKVSKFSSHCVVFYLSLFHRLMRGKENKMRSKSIATVSVIHTHTYIFIINLAKQINEESNLDIYFENELK